MAADCILPWCTGWQGLSLRFVQKCQPVCIESRAGLQPGRLQQSSKDLRVHLGQQFLCLCQWRHVLQKESQMLASRGQTLAQQPRGWCSLLKMTAFAEATVVVRTILTIARKWPQTLDVSGVVELACARMVDTTPKRRTPATHQVTLTQRQPQRCSQQLPRLHQRRVPASATRDANATGTIVSGSPGAMAATGSMACAAAPTMGSFSKTSKKCWPRSGSPTPPPCGDCQPGHRACFCRCRWLPTVAKCTGNVLYVHMICIAMFAKNTTVSRLPGRTTP